MRTISKILLTLIVVVVALGTVGTWWFYSLRPDYQGNLKIEGLQNKVSVLFDDYGVPHIDAQNEHDAYLALGYVHAQDRLFQMEMLRRLASGRLAEVLGKDLIKVDKLFRTLGLTQQARENAKKLLSGDSSGYQVAAHAYLKGVNAFIRSGKKPIEFSLIGIPLQEFSDEDIFLVAGYMAFSFAEAMRVDPVYEKLKINYPGYAEAAFGTPEGNASKSNQTRIFNNSTANTEAVVFQELREALNHIPVPLLMGSNGWVIDGSKTKSGKPILANDTHIGFAQPAVWYEAQLTYPGFNFYGHHIAGVPFGVLGNNDFCAWGITMFENDDMDFYREKINPADSNQVANGAQWETISEREEIIHVKDQADVLLKVKSTRHGPIINSVVDGASFAKEPISLWWSFLKLPVNLIQSFYDLNHANTLHAARRAVSGITAPGLNIIYADTSGNIAWWAAARLPVRTMAQSQQSRYFRDGADPSEDVVDYLPFEKNPSSVNPPWGYVHTGNNQPEAVDGVLYPGYYYPRDRSGRIEKLLVARKDWTAELVSEMQLDNKSETAPEVAKVMAELVGDHPFAGILKAWDGGHELTSTGPAVYYTLLSRLIFGAMADEVGYSELDALLSSSVLKGNYREFLLNDSTGWWDDVRTAGRETRKEMVEIAVQKTEATLRARGGFEVAWEKVHYLKHGHPLGAVEMLDKIFSVGPFPVSGGSEVINNLMFPLDTTGIFAVTAGPALRKVHELSDLSQGWTVSPSGQSGVLASEHYSDQAEMFAQGKVRKMLMKGDRSTMRELVLEPR
ncbi:MAG: penicillin acylase family protein [Bacteroidetes bacterium]|nr:penicillin acylase family protein [Bacteroidota bacterium]